MPGAVEQMRKAEISPLAGLPAPKEMLVDLARLEREYFERRPDISDSNQMVKFGTSGHRGSPLDGTFTEAHILAITQAICDYRRTHGPDGPLYLGKDTHAVSDPAQQTALEVLAANGVNTIIQTRQSARRRHPSSRARILRYNRGRKSHLADGIVVTPSHNPPEDGGFKYNPPNGGPADTDVTAWIQDRANELLREGNAGVKRVQLRFGHPRRDHAPKKTSSCPTCTTLRKSSTWRRSGTPVSSWQSIRWAEPRLHYWDPINSTLRTRCSAVVNRTTRPHLFLHDSRSRRANPHGLLQPLCDGRGWSG